MGSFQGLVASFLLTLPLVPQQALAGPVDASRLEARSTSDQYYPRRALHAVAVVDDYLYIEGGEYSVYNSTSQKLTGGSTTLKSTLSIPLNKSWSNSSVEFNEITKSEPVPINNLGLWSDGNSTMYRWGGDGSGGNTTVGESIHLWAMETDGQGGGTWAISTPGNSDTFDDLYSGASAGVASCNGMGYYVGGYGSGASDERLNATVFNARMPLPGILTYNMTTKDWANESSVALDSPYGSWVSGEAVCETSLTTNPLVFVLGGETTTRTSAARVDDTFTDMSNITFYDPINNKWHWQKATGDVPDSRELFCAVGVKSNYTYDIYIYGGVHGSAGTYSDIHVLSLPAFEWFDVGISSPERLRHACALAGNSQMISVGGLAEEWDYGTRDPWVEGLGVFDLVNWEWSDSYDPDAQAYETPKTIKSWYEDGGLDSMDWSTTDVEKIFSSAVSSAEVAFASSNSSSSSLSSSSSSSSSKSSTNVGAIAGGTVGGVAFVALLGAIYWLWYRKQKATKGGYETPKAEPKSNSELDSTPVMEKTGVDQKVFDGYGPVMELAGNHGHYRAIEMPA